MNRLALKMLLDHGSPLDSAAFQLLFHRIIQEDLLPGEKIIDVISYRHVYRAPWVLLICTNGQYALDGGGGRPGLKYSAEPGVDLTVLMAKLLELAKVCEEQLNIRFRRDEWELEIADRGFRPNTREAFTELTGELAPAISRLFTNAEITWTGAADLLGPMRVRLKVGAIRNSLMANSAPPL